ncbi:nucleolar protein 56-like [Papaver somniferum]|uniref:nucleolar protein 56-like n=1 Tax=Papaver somniferum TaxID=3469 RepID=UPI000E6F8D4B|nr:nucleolar protein 56-like [Papaver somniferum]
MALYLLFEATSGYSLIQDYGIDDIGRNTEAVRNSVVDVNRFAEVVQIVAFSPFDSALDALNQYNAVSEGIMTEELRNFLELKLPKVKKGEKPQFSLGVADPKIGSQIFKETKIPCQSDEFILELLRGIRFHYETLISDFYKSPLAGFLGHPDSRATEKEKFNVDQVDDMVFEAISTLDTLDKDFNSSSMELRLWYARHFPELFDIVNDNYIYAEVVNYVENKSELSEHKIPRLTEILGDDEDKAKEIVETAKASMGQDLSPIDLIHVKQFSQKVMDLAQHKKHVHEYLVYQMNEIAPDLAFVIGEIVGARHAGCSIASRNDCFLGTGITVYGEKLRRQVEERLGCYDVDMMKAEIDIKHGGSAKRSSNETEIKGEILSLKYKQADLLINAKVK